MSVHGHEYDGLNRLQAVYPDRVIDINLHKHKHVSARISYDCPSTIWQALVEVTEDDKHFLFDEALRLARGIPWCFSKSDGTIRRPFYKLIMPKYIQFCAYEPRSAKEDDMQVVVVVGCCHCKKEDVKMNHCTGCVGTQYCSTQCQEAAWSSHKKFCRLPNASDQFIEVFWELAGMHFAYGEYDVAAQAAVFIQELSTSSMRWGRIGQQK
ncbi:hypothetical protein T484DRAFT_1758512, partial [Baffinella frigidus]